MKQRKLFLPIIAAILLFSSTAFAKGVATTMGNLQLVGRDGPFDAMRSPALLVGNKENNGAGLAVDYQFWNDQSAKGNMIISNTDYTNNYDKPDTTEYEGALAYLTKLGSNMALGIAYEREYDKTTSKMQNSLMGSMRTETTEKNVMNHVMIGMGYALSQNLSLGVGLGVDYNNSQEDENEVISGNRKDTTTKTKNLILNATIGLLYTMDKTQLGLAIDAGQYNQIKKDKSVNDIGNAYSASKSVSGYWKYTQGPGAFAGIYQNLTPLIDVAAEAGIVLPRKYDGKSLEADGDNKTIYETKAEVDQKLTYTLRGGIALNATKELTVSLGAVYGNIKIDNITTKASSKETIKTTGYHLMGTLGFDYKLTTATKINLFGFYQQNKIKFEMNETGTDPIIYCKDFTTKSFNAGLSATQMF